MEYYLSYQIEGNDYGRWLFFIRIIVFTEHKFWRKLEHQNLDR